MLLYLREYSPRVVVSLEFHFPPLLSNDTPSERANEITLCGRHCNTFRPARPGLLRIKRNERQQQGRNILVYSPLKSAGKQKQTSQRTPTHSLTRARHRPLAGGG